VDLLRPPQSVLFCCTMNAIRSPMAEGLLKRRFGTRLFVDSCGLRKADHIDPMAVLVMDELGVDLYKHRPKSFAELEDDSFDLIISLAPQAHHRALEYTRHLAVEVIYWPTLDPSVMEGTRDARLDTYRDVRDSLDRRIGDYFAMLKGPS
jgi:protein-tyrosine-phosphatase